MRKLIPRPEFKRYFLDGKHIVETPMSEAQARQWFRDIDREAKHRRFHIWLSAMQVAIDMQWAQENERGPHGFSL